MGLTRLTISVPTDRIRAIRPEGIHAVTCSWLDGDAHHADRKPFAATPAYQVADGRVSYEVVAFTDRAAIAVREGMSRPARFGRLEFPAGSLELTEVGRIDWSDLEASPQVPVWSFQCLTPLVIRSSTFQGVSVTPGTFFGHLRKLWRRHADRPIDVDFERAGLVVEGHDLEMVTAVLRGERVGGFLGPISFRALHGDRGTLRSLTALARLAEWTGVGARTTFGMGVVRRL